MHYDFVGGNFKHALQSKIKIYTYSYELLAIERWDKSWTCLRSEVDIIFLGEMCRKIIKRTFKVTLALALPIKYIK